MKTIVTPLKLCVCLLAFFPAGAMAQAAAGSASASSAAASAATGANGPLLQKAIEANAQGTCPADLMGPELLAACQQQIAGIHPMLTAKGKITKLDFLGTQGQAEIWRVTYEHGDQVWGIAVGSDGKIAGMWTHDN